jgi:hypothetical protein
VDALLQTYPNLYGDLSAGSGHNALTRDETFGPSFLERNKDHLLFGTDYLKPGQETPIVEYMQNTDISDQARESIVRRNAERILSL